MKNPVVHFEIMSAPGGAQALRQFYADTFGWQYNVVPEDYALVDYTEGERGIGGAVIEGKSANVVISIEVPDVAAALEQAKANGAEIIEEETVIPGMVTYGIFRDPAGNAMGVVAETTPPAE